MDSRAGVHGVHKLVCILTCTPRQRQVRQSGAYTYIMAKTGVTKWCAHVHNGKDGCDKMVHALHHDKDGSEKMVHACTLWQRRV